MTTREAEPPRRRLATLVVVPIVLAAIAVGGGLAIHAASDGGGEAAGAAPLDLSTVTADVAGHYHASRTLADTYREVPCYCGCEEFLAHRNLYDCFVRADGAGWEAHASTCAVCIDESAVIRELAAAGAPVTAIRQAVIDRFGAAPPTTGPVFTGEVSAMGMPVIETPGSASGVTRAGAVVVSGASWHLGQVPLDVAVRPTWTLRNTGVEPVVVGEPRPEVRSGCCPGGFSIDRATIPPGATATLSFELAMHAGMDGWHDIAVHLPLRSGAAEHVLLLDVTGDFRDG